MPRYIGVLFSVLFLQLFYFTLHAQKPDVKFGKVSMEELKMQVYPKDTSAGAVVLFDRGYFYSSTSNFKRLTRIKILKASALDQANIIKYNADKSKIDGYTYNLAENGEILKEKLKASAVYREVLEDGYVVLKALLPNVKVGSVIDIEYEYFGIPYQWYFQDDIPTLWSEFTIEPSFGLTMNLYGFEPLHIKDNFYWAAKDVPAIKAEPFMGAIKDNITRVELRFDRYGEPPSWSTVSRILMKNENFNHRLDHANFLNATADSIMKASSNDLEKIEKALAHIKKQMQWNEVNSLTTYHPLSQSYTKKSNCSSAAINLTLVALLRKLKLDAHPVVLSTRDNGVVSPQAPSVRKLNHTIVYVKSGGEALLIDATEKNAPAGLLPQKCLNFWGWIIGPNLYEEVSLVSKVKHKKTFLSRITIPDNLSSVDYQLDISYDGYAALDKRNTLADISYDEQNHRSSFEEANGVTIKDYQTYDREIINKPIKEHMVLQKQAERSAGLVFISPIVGQQFLKNPFYLEKRLNPVDFVYPISETYITTITIPPGYEVESIPQSTAHMLPRQGGRLLYQITRLENTLQLKYIFEINERLYLTTEYKELQDLFNLYVSKTKEQIVLKKI